MTVEEAPFFSIDGPLLVLPRPGTVRGQLYFQRFKALVHSYGGDSREILEQHGVDPAATEDPDYALDCASGVAILGYCAERFHDNLFGLHLAECQAPDVFGSLYTLARAAPTLRAALDSLVEYVAVLHSPGAEVEYVSTNETAELRYCPYSDEAASDQQTLTHGLLLIVKFFESLIGPTFRPSYVNAVANLARDKIEFMESRFRCRIYTRAPMYALGIPASYLDQPLATADRFVFGLLNSYLSRVKRATRNTLVDQVETYVQSELSSGSCSLERCAAKLGTTTRTLARHLNQMGLNFSDIFQQQRSATAMRILLETDYSMDKVARSLGYSERSSFGRAFRRWTKTPPQAFRESKRAADIEQVT